MKFSWWLLALVLALGLIFFSVLANQRRYKYLRMAYRLHKSRGVEGEFLDYVLMESTDLSYTPITEVSMMKRKELAWSKAATISYGLTVTLCAAVMVLSFYGILKEPKWVSFLFLTLLMASSYINYRFWRHFKFVGRR